MKTVVVLLLAAALICACAGGAAAVVYSARILCGIGSGPLCEDVNNSGKVLIQSFGQTNLTKILNLNGTSVPTPGLQASVVGINDSGTVVCSSHRTGLTWSQSAGMVDLPEPPGYSFSASYAINESGQVAGWAEGVSFEPCVWSSDGQPRVLPGLAGFSGGTAWCISDSGMAGGWCGDYWGAHMACVWDTAGDATPLGIPGRVYAISNAGQAVGGRDDGGAFFWSVATGAIDLGDGQAIGINDSGVAVGCTGKPPWQADFRLAEGYASTAFVWTLQAGRVALPTPAGMGPHAQTGAYTINNEGIIVGWAMDGLSQSRYAVLWEPVPEPAAVSVLLCGLIGTAVTCRRKR